MNILINNVELNGSRTSIAISGNRIASIGMVPELSYDTVIDGSHAIAVPPFYNMHTHAPMSLLRGYADDMELMDWLQNHIWPAEAHLQAEDYYWGTRLACMEMIRSGIVTYTDMYFEPQECIRAIDDAGIRAVIGMMILEASPNGAKYEQDSRDIWAKRDMLSSRVKLSISPHAIYTVSADGLRACAELSQRETIPLQIHVAETAFEVQQCKEQHNGMTPVEYLDSLGVLSPQTIAAHSIHLTEHDIDIYAERGVCPVFNPCSNLKLCSGLFPFRTLIDRGIPVTIGTDGAASNNNLSMFDEMKTAAMIAKLQAQSPLGATAEEIYTAATATAPKVLGIDAGVIAPGKLADIVLLDADSPYLTPSFNLTSNLVYSADTSCVSTVICDGSIIMLNHVIPDEDEILANARRCAKRLVQ